MLWVPWGGPPGVKATYAYWRMAGSLYSPPNSRIKSMTSGLARAFNDLYLGAEPLPSLQEPRVSRGNACVGVI